ncbi:MULTISPECIES: cephalosporin hydroxylase family protein [Achromobacter]|uniref:Rhamnosyl O-methyltransferase n=1 Tax=Achromobacter piechaudii TaxID=72556 RepID=A0A6S7EPQ6_9BURK|nr:MULTISPECIES: cephalosporin hydroxylase family protein [Achromobacter]MPS79488.1 cephalosporin hydroxylase [Achromobacter sp.]CAB3920830.1 Rhamnosyl O-methyltransferase [Achromobacter piechaudii]
MTANLTPVAEFEQLRTTSIQSLGQDAAVSELSNAWMQATAPHRYTYNFSWMGRPIIQFPQDVFAMQELIWAVQPDLIIETGIAHGGSLIFSAAMLELNAACGGPAEAHVIGIDIDIRAHNRQAIEAHPMFKRITLVQGSSVDDAIVEQVRQAAVGKQRVMACLDSNHTHAHVLAELRAFAPLVSIGSYCVVFDTAIEDVPAEMFPDRDWGPGNSPKSAVWEYLRENDDFSVDASIHQKLQITVAPDGYLKRMK